VACLRIRRKTEFDLYLRKAQITFGSSGLALTKPAAGEHLWKRALLAIGDYLLSNGSNSSFLTDPPSNWDSWKRLLRGDDGKRTYLKALWDRLAHDADIEPQLNDVIKSATDLEPWRAIIEEIYLLNKTQMNGNHAELFSYGLYLDLGKLGVDHELSALASRYYESVSTTDAEPRLVFRPECAGQRLKIAVESSNGQFLVCVSRSELASLPELATALRDDVGLDEQFGTLSRRVLRADIHEVLRQVASTLQKFST